MKASQNRKLASITPAVAGLALLLGASLAAVQAAGPEPRLAVTQTAAYEGGYGLEVTVTPCLLPIHLIIEPPPTTVTGPHEACQSVQVNGVQVATSGAQFRAGSSISIGDGFVVPENALMEATVDTSLSPFVWVEDQSPSGELSYKARYHARLDGLVIGPGETFDNFSVYSSSANVPVFRVIFKRDSQDTENRILLAARQDDGSEVTTPWGQEQLLPAGWNRIEVDWQAGSGTGHLLLSLNGNAFSGLTGLSNAQTGRVDHVRWGVVDSASGVALVASGTIDLDSFTSWRG